MTTEITLPELGESVSEATISVWLKAVGDEVAEGEALVEVSTDKVDTEVPSPVTGTVLSIVAAEDTVVTVGAVLATVGSVSAPATVAPQATIPVFESQGEVPISLLVAGRAAERGVDLETVVGTGAGGRVRLADVDGAQPSLAAQLPRAPFIVQLSTLAPLPALVLPTGTIEASVRAEPMTSLPAVSEVEPSTASAIKLSRLRGTIARRMVDSLQTSAQLTSVIEIDVSVVADTRKKAGASYLARNGVKLSFMPLFAAAVVRALASHPQLNASIADDLKTATYHPAVNLSIAVDTDRGLLAPVVRGAGDLTVDALGRAIDDLASRTRDGAVTADELGGGTFTLSNTGSRGSLFDTPIINQPQVAILATGAITRRPVVVTQPRGDESISIRSMAYFALTYDHRLVDGADAARFLTTVKTLLEDSAFVRALVAMEQADA